jgi:hypothetical protein
MSGGIIEQPDPAQVEMVRKWIVEGMSRHDIGEMMREEFTGADGKRLLAAAIASINVSAYVGEDTIRGWCLEAYREIYRRAMEGGDNGTALRAIKQILEMARDVRDDGQAEEEAAETDE